MHLFPLIDVMGKRLNISEWSPPYFVVLGSTAVKNIIFFSLVFKFCIWIFLSGWLHSLSSNVQLSHFCVDLFHKMILDEIFCEAWPSLHETLFDFLQGDFCCWDENYCMKLLCQFWFICLVQNTFYHNFLLLCL